MKKLIVLFVAFLMLVFCNANVSQAVTLSFDPLSQDVLVGDQVDVGLVKWSGIVGQGVGHFFTDMLPYYIWGNNRPAEGESDSGK